jgi:hypothetical protein
LRLELAQRPAQVKISSTCEKKRRRSVRLKEVDPRVDAFGQCELLYLSMADLSADTMHYRYTVHEKAQNFAVPIPLEQGWHDEQIDELFSSLLGGAGLEGAGGTLETFDEGMTGMQVDEIPALDMQGGMVAGLRVF